MRARIFVSWALRREGKPAIAVYEIGLTCIVTCWIGEYMKENLTVSITIKKEISELVRKISLCHSSNILC